MSGTGKELVARAYLQQLCPRRQVVCHRQLRQPAARSARIDALRPRQGRAFTGAVYPKKGLFDLADKGSIFFDEIGNIPLETQAKLLRVMQERSSWPWRHGDTQGGRASSPPPTSTSTRSRGRPVSRRLVLSPARHRHPPAALRERKDDIPLLVQHFQDKYGAENTGPAGAVARRARCRWSTTGPATCASWRTSSNEDGARARSRIGPDLIPEHVRRAPTSRCRTS